MAITSYDNLIGLISSSGFQNNISFFKLGIAANAAGQWNSLWTYGGQPGPGVRAPNGATAPSGGIYCYSHPTGGIYFSGVSPLQRYLTTFGCTATTSCVVMIYDRLWMANLQLTAVGVSGCVLFNPSGTLPRYPTDKGLQAWIEVTVATATTAPVLKLSGYYNQDNNLSVGTNLTLPATATPIGFMAQLPFGSGDYGVLGITGIQLVTSGTAGAANLMIIKPLAYIPIQPNIWNEKDLVLQFNSLPRIYDGATLGIAYLTSITTATNFYGQIRTVYG